MGSNAFLPGGYVTQAPDTSQPIAITDGDKQGFEQLLLNIQQAWSEGDLTRLRQFVTPEMLQYFSEELSANSSRGLANKMEQVKLEDADVVESWHEYNLDYATARMRFTALDYMVKLDKHPADADYIASGNAKLPQEAQEYWTFTPRVRRSLAVIGHPAIQIVSRFHITRRRAA